MDLKIVFENNSFIAVDKPALMLTTPSRLGVNESRPCLGLLLQDRVKKTIFPIHRLDFEVSGLTLFALDAKAHAEANSWFEKRFIKKTYFALTMGPELSHPQSEIIWENKIVKGKKRSFVAPHGKPAKTIAHWKGANKIGQGQWILNPETGRSHQLRLHLSNFGHPIIGDTLYGSTQVFQLPGIALRSISLDFRSCPGVQKYGLEKLEISQEF